MGDRILQRPPGQHRNTISPTLEIHRLSVRRMERRQFGQAGDLIDAARALRRLVDLLKRNEIGLRRKDDFGDPFEVEFPIGALPVVNVVGQNTQRAGGILGKRLGRYSDQRSPEKEGAKDTTGHGRRDWQNVVGTGKDAPFTTPSGFRNNRPRP